MGRLVCLKISTHAPAGGATRQGSFRHLFCSQISTHAPAGGATGIKRKHDRERDCISTHAPAGGATLDAYSLSRGEKFLLTPLREGRRRKL